MNGKNKIGFILLNFRTYYKTLVMNTVWAAIRLDSPITKLDIYQGNSMERESWFLFFGFCFFSINGTHTTGYPWV